jgi:uncharacterized protein
MPNRLANSTSPYLQQHADNPVDWYEWGPEALALARESQKPVMLSIGYSACHWCHVMAHESFEDDGIAALMNELFINIKVDREERPDIDQIYQSAHAMLTQRSGGWPLTMFLTPDTTPFFGGTYFPKTARYGLPGFGDLLKRVSGYYREQQTAIREQNTQLLAAISRQKGPESPANAGVSDFAPTREPIDAALHNIADTFDAKRGGFGQAPKFPHPEMMEFCLRRFAERSGESQQNDAKHMACFTLECMCKGGIYDQVGGGFARYSVDAEWAIPHFEKMLYDNGPMLRLLAAAWLVAENEPQKKLFARCAEETVAWVLREMQSPAGGYYSTLDADSEGHEGKFYVWTPDEVKSLLTAEEWRVIEPHFGLNKRANFEDHFWNFIIAEPIEALAKKFEQPESQIEALVASAKQKLFAARKLRIHPGRDEKILTSWNALMIEGMAFAARVFDRPDWLQSARSALTFVRNTMWNAGTRRLNATHKDGKTHLNAYLDDYAYLLKAILELIQTDFNADDLAFAQQLADVLLEQFEDKTRGGFFFTSHDHEQLIQRPKPSFDNATPSGNGVAALALMRLSHLTHDQRYVDAAARTLACFFHAIDDHPSGHGSLLMALEEYLTPMRLVILTGEPNETAVWQREIVNQWRPTTVSLVLPPAVGANAPGLPTALVRPPLPGVNAYVCEGVSCLPAIGNLYALKKQLSG